jgi:hypothetical protein
MVFLVEALFDVSDAFLDLRKEDVVSDYSHQGSQLFSVAYFLFDLR